MRLMLTINYSVKRGTVQDLVLINDVGGLLIVIKLYQPITTNHTVRE